jgi:uncharacterized protein involved in outer membrane biogenesis
MPSASDDSSSSPLARIARWGGGILGGLLVLILAAALILPQLFTSEELKGYVVPPLEEATGRPVQIDEIGLRVLWTPAVSVSGFTLADREGYGPEPAVSAGALNVEVAVWPLLTGSIQPTAVELVDPVIRYTVAEDGSTNFDDLMASDTTQADAGGDGGLGIPISNFRTTGAQVRYEDRSTGQALHLDFDARLSARPDGDALTSAGTIDVAALRAVLPSVQADTMTVTDATITYDVRAALGAGRLDLSTLTVETAPLTLSTTGTVTEFNTTPVLDLTVEATEADLEQLAAFAPAAAVEGLNPRGTLQLTTTLTGPLSEDGGLDALTVDGTGRLSGIGVDYQGQALLRDLNADVALSRTEMALRSLQGQLLGTSLSGSVAVSDPMGAPRVALDVKTGAMDLATLSAFAPPEQVTGLNPQGTLALDLTATGPVDAPDKLTLDGGGELAGVGVDYDGTSVLRDLGATLAFSNTAASVKNLKGQLLGKPVEGTLTVREPMGEGATVEGRLAGAADLAELASVAGQEDAGSGTADYDVRFSGPVYTPDAIRPSGTVRLRNVRYPYESFRHPVEIPDATVKLTGTGLSMDRFTLTTGEQSMAVQATAQNLFPVSEGLAETNPALALDFTLTADRLDLVELYPEEDGSGSEVYYSQLFAATLSGSKIKGQSPEAVAEELYGGTELPAFAVDGDVTITTFLNDPQRIDDLSFDLQVRNRRLTMRNLSGRTYGGQLAGRITLDQRGPATSAVPGRRSVLLAGAPGGAAPLAPPAPSDLTYDVTLEDAKASAFLQDWTRLGQAVKGTLDLKMDGDTPLTAGFLPVADALTAEGTSLVADGGLSLDLGVTKALVNKLGLDPSAVKFTSFGGPFTIADGALKMGPWTMGGTGPKTEIDGALGLGGRLDATMRMDLPLSTLKKSKIPGLAGDGALTGLVQKLSGGDGTTVPLKIGVGGTMTQPTLEIVDKGALKTALQKLVKKEGLDRVRNLFEGGGE